ncbi:nucleoside triphosphate pyrophosphohydrolase [Acinetobacter gerneri]|uniref:Nucleoside triphosphate pyrophosphohydrolase n=1 Tax=Acinetobacter gerneri TaxID=202952 RepID=A0AAW8JHK6_9GAMM|nr:nucleoside triphosphate pyrophosphohydrolase [Acinetobacter gerneri]MDQ9010355.1 nucleoside triphosphate pyrophosphohydrolase [Acinetobacter gerneri]MDQ9014554.1 nucleoside triphosphate pyrophosphohydrolase [Acinetobacter gerneri]MDQ9025725.1 nucleoside triphosphate pyrophosphohydrolase [Acinetobacter gerneri]MDQ9053006.1 nucleoside triphosphate pyrophosphohydrolase [Acinetobacter gerneri]MDQ9060556.1 nucleoside triphosphate pyrophosphohydrolase [Acinetobacter gerneri]
MQKLLQIMQELREKCPWDKAQTPESLTPYAIEEAYEVEAAVRGKNPDEVRDELSDLLLQVVFQAQMYKEQGDFDFDDVVEAISQKLIRRHPHVFEAEKFQDLTPEQVSALWKEIKIQEKKGKPQSRLNEIKHGPALVQAEQIQKNVAKIGFDFPDINGAYAKVEEELAEFRQALQSENSDEILDEFGDCLFSLINVGRKLNISSEMALLATIDKFKARFGYIEDQARQNHKNLEEMSLEEMDQLWDEAKVFLKANQQGK